MNFKFSITWQSKELEKDYVYFLQFERKDADKLKDFINIKNTDASLFKRFFLPSVQTYDFLQEFVKGACSSSKKEILYTPKGLQAATADIYFYCRPFCQVMQKKLNDGQFKNWYMLDTILPEYLDFDPRFKIHVLNNMMAERGLDDGWLNSTMPPLIMAPSTVEEFIESVQWTKTLYDEVIKYPKILK